MYQLGSQEDDQKVTKMSEEPQRRRPRLHQQKSKGGNFIFHRDANPPKSHFCTKSDL